MKKILIIIFLTAAVSFCKAQTNPFPSTDSVERFINRWIRNSAVEAFQNLRLNTVLISLLRYVQNSGVGSGVDTAYVVNDSTLRIITTEPDTFNIVIRGKPSVTSTRIAYGGSDDRLKDDADLTYTEGTNRLNTGTGNFVDSLLVGRLRTGTSSDSVVVWDNITKALKKVVGSSFITASNGLTKTGNDIQLGGFLNQNTLIDGNDSYTWRLLGATQISFSTISGGDDDGDITFSATDTIHMNAAYHKFNFLSRNAAGFMKPILYDTINHLIYYGDVSTSGGSSGSAYGIDSTVISGTAGSVLFVGTGPVLAQDNANFFWDNSNKRLGIGTASPARGLHVSLADAATNSVTSMGRWTHSTSGTAAAGFGLNREINLENASGTDINAATEVFSWSDATNASEDAAWTLNLVRGGSLAQAATISSLGALTIGNSLVASGSATIGASNSYIFSGRSSMNSSTNGDINLFNNAQNGFGRLNFGGTSSSFPALLRSSANLIVRLADNSANTDLEVLDEAYDATTWNGSNEVPTKNATRDKIEGMNIVQGTYTPTLTNGANVDASTVPGTTLYYKREGNQVTVWGMVTIDPNASAATTVLSISLPIASALTSYTQLSGQATGNIVAGAYFGGFIQGDDTNDRAQLDFVSGTTLNQTWSIRFTYEIL